MREKVQTRVVGKTQFDQVHGTLISVFGAVVNTFASDKDWLVRGTSGIVVQYRTNCVISQCFEALSMCLHAFLFCVHEIHQETAQMELRHVVKNCQTVTPFAGSSGALLHPSLR